jgi:hypothetical protein
MRHPRRRFGKDTVLANIGNLVRPYKRDSDRFVGVALLDDPDADRLLQLDLETAALDFLALEGGYTRGGRLVSGR